MILVDVDAATGGVEYRPGYRVVSGVELDSRGRRVVTVIADARLRTWRQLGGRPGPDSVIGEQWPTDLVRPVPEWWSL